MRYENRVPEELIREDGHYVGRPADFTDKIIERRIKLIEQIPGFVSKNASLLDIGCGNGASMFLLSSKMKNCDGIDINDDHLEEFKWYQSKEQIQNCTFKIVDILNSRPNKKYDRIISFEVIEHLTNENDLSYYSNSLERDGILAVSVPNKWWIFETHGAKLPLLPWNRVPFFSWLPKPIHEKFANARIYTKSRIVKLLESNGFEVIDVKYIMAPMDVLPKGKIKDFVVKYIFSKDTTKIPFKSTSIFVVAKKKS